MFGIDHGKVGGYLLGLWGLPDPIVEAVSFHHDPREIGVDEFLPLTCVHIGESINHESSNSLLYSPANLDMEYIAALGLKDSLARWKEELCNV